MEQDVLRGLLESALRLHLSEAKAPANPAADLQPVATFTEQETLLKAQDAPTIAGPHPTILANEEAGVGGGGAETSPGGKDGGGKDGGGKSQEKPAEGKDGKTQEKPSDKPPEEKGGKTGGAPPSDPDDGVTCKCRFTEIVSANDPKLVNKQTIGASCTTYKYVNGSDIRGSGSTNEGFSDATAPVSAAGGEEYQITHVNPCPECKGKAWFYAIARTKVSAEASATSEAYGGKSSAKSNCATAAEGFLNYKVVAAANVTGQEDSNVEIEIEIPIKGANVKVKYKPKWNKSGYKPDEATISDKQQGQGDSIEWSIASKGDETADSDGRSKAAASFSSKNVAAWVAICKCPRHKGLTRTLMHYAAVDAAEGDDLQKQLEKAFINP